jgi:hypothetical protein
MRYIKYLLSTTIILLFISLNASAQKNWRLFSPSKKVEETEKDTLERKENLSEENLSLDTLGLTDEPIEMPEEGALRILGDERVKTLFELQAEKNKESLYISGFRIQIFFGNRTESNNFKARFLELYPDEKVYVSYLAPNFRVRVGDYRNRFKAEKQKKIFSEHFPNCYIVPDQIELPKLKESATEVSID